MNPFAKAAAVAILVAGTTCIFSFATDRDALADLGGWTSRVHDHPTVDTAGAFGTPAALPRACQWPGEGMARIGRSRLVVHPA